MFKFLLASFLSSIYFLYGLTVNNGWSLYGSGDNEINLSSTFSQYSNISYVWTYSNGVWSGYGNNSGLKTKLSNAKITQINLIKPYTAFWILNGADSVDINLSINGSNANIVLGKDWNLVSSGGSKVDFNRTFGTNSNVLIIWNWDNEKQIWKAFSNNELIKNNIKYNNITETAFSDEVSAFWVLNFSDSNITFQTATVPTFKNFEFWGEWKSIDKNETIYVTSLTDKTIEKITENLIKIDSGYYLKNGERNVTISGSLVNDGSGEVSSRRLNSPTIDMFVQTLVKLRNRNDPNINATIKVNANGTFKDSSLPTGNYILTATNNDKSIEANVSLERDQKELGTFKLVPKGIANFQINFELNNSEFLYGNGQSYNGSIVIKNIGDAIGIGLAYESINIDGANNLSINSNKILGSIPINGEKQIPISFSFNEQNSNEKYYDINISVKDNSNRFWYEHVTIPVYKSQ